MVSIFWSEPNFQCAAVCCGVLRRAFNTPTNRPPKSDAAACFNHWCLPRTSPVAGAGCGQGRPDTNSPKAAVVGLDTHQEGGGGGAPVQRPDANGGDKTFGGCRGCVGGRGWDVGGGGGVGTRPRY